jgi:hypothetical protein
VSWQSILRGALLGALFFLLAACGGSSPSSGSSGSSGSSSAPQKVQGIATPKSISVVTANNAS